MIATGAAVLEGLAALVTVLGLGAAAVAAVVTRAVRPTLAVLLDFLLAAGLLRLGGDPAWHVVGTAAAVVVLRKVVVADVREGAAATAPE